MEEQQSSVEVEDVIPPSSDSPLPKTLSTRRSLRVEHEDESRDIDEGIEKDKEEQKQEEGGDQKEGEDNNIYI